MNGSRLLKKSIGFVLAPRPDRLFLRSVKGFTFLAVMFAIVLIGLSLTGAVQQWKTIMKREREAELLFRGDQIRKAIAYYYVDPRTPGPLKYPQKLEDLVKVPNTSATKRFLRKVYKDPVTNEDWGIVPIGDRIRGVYSKSDEEPLKQANFPDEYKMFEGKTKYSEWVFEFTPQQVQPPQPIPPQRPSPTPPTPQGR
jgi:type II secretory pathway pseudopilin PulG